MKAIKSLLFLALVTANIAHADSCATGLMPVFTAAQAKEICTTFSAGVIATLANNTYAVARNAADSANINVWKVDATDDTVLNADTGDVIKLSIAGTSEVQVDNDSLTFTGAAASIIGGATSITLGSAGSTILDAQNDPQRLLTYSGTSDTALTLTWGDGGTTASQTLTLLASTSDADDDYKLSIGAGGAALGTRGGYITMEGNENAGGGRTTVGSGAGVLNLATDSANRWQVGTDGKLNALATNGGDLNMSGTGLTVALQEATAGSACMGTLTANGATPVVTSTTCALTGSRIFLTRTSAETGVVNAWISAINTGVSFSITGEAGDTGTYNWIIFHEAS